MAWSALNSGTRWSRPYCNVSPGSREPTSAERQRLESALGRSQLRLLVAETPDLVAVRGIRCVVVSRDLLDVFEDRALTGLLNQTAAPVRAANLAGFLLVWLGNLPLLLAWCANRLIGQFGRLLAVLVGSSLVLPLILFRDAFLSWTGRLFTAMLVALIGAVLVSGGHAALGFAMLLAWVIVPSLRAILAWESRRAECGRGREDHCRWLRSATAGGSRLPGARRAVAGRRRTPASFLPAADEQRQAGRAHSARPDAHHTSAESKQAKPS